ncbi:hypothetical protein BDR05DRAFT_1003621 [Suillus weaverae]|nr:hypothetical protein BDR05DRAFT_1003621 [Suillus weaverae]
MNRWNTHESSALSYSVGGIGFKVLFLFEAFLPLLLLHFFAVRFLCLFLSESELLDEELELLDDELSVVLLDDELVVSEDPESDELVELFDELSSGASQITLGGNLCHSIHGGRGFPVCSSSFSSLSSNASAAPLPSIGNPPGIPPPPGTPTPPSLAPIARPSIISWY